jgi:hypothetical protein
LHDVRFARPIPLCSGSPRASSNCTHGAPGPSWEIVPISRLRASARALDPGRRGGRGVRRRADDVYRSDGSRRADTAPLNRRSACTQFVLVRIMEDRATKYPDQNVVTRFGERDRDSHRRAAQAGDNQHGPRLDRRRHRAVRPEPARSMITSPDEVQPGLPARGRWAASARTARGWPPVSPLVKSFRCRP